jgi:hypothetical protein
MTKGHLLAATCALALFVAGPAFAQSSGTTGTGNEGTSSSQTMPNANMGGTGGSAAMGNNTTGSDMTQNSGGMTTTPGGGNAGTNENMGGNGTSGNANMGANSGMQGNTASTEGGTMGRSHRTRMTRAQARAMRRGNANPDAQNSDVDRLNQESLQAAQTGKTFSPSSGSGSMGDNGMGGQSNEGASPSGSHM